MKFSRLLVPAAFFAALLSVRGEILLKGVTVVEGKPLFSLYSTEDQTSKWVSLGQSFSGFKAIDFDPLTDSLIVADGDSRQTIRLQTVAIKDSGPEDAKARLRTLTGIELAYELVRRGDGELGEKLKLYQSILVRLGQISATTQAAPGPATDAVKFLTATCNELRAEVEKVAAVKAALLLAAPAKP